MKAKKIALAGIAAYIFDVLTSIVCRGVIFNKVYKIETSEGWRLAECIPPLSFFIGAFVLSIALAIIYALLKNAIPGRNSYIKGLIFGFFIWVAGVLPGALAVLSFMAIEPLAMLYWISISFAQTPLKCLIISSIYQS